MRNGILVMLLVIFLSSNGKAQFPATDPHWELVWSDGFFYYITNYTGEFSTYNVSGFTDKWPLVYSWSLEQRYNLNASGYTCRTNSDRHILNPGPNSNVSPDPRAHNTYCSPGCSLTINTGNNVSFRSEDYTHLGQGFDEQPGADFLGSITGICH